MWEEGRNRRVIFCCSEKGRIYKIRFQFLPPEIYQEEFSVTPHKILLYMESTFFKKMTKDIDDKRKALSKAK